MHQGYDNQGGCSRSRGVFAAVLLFLTLMVPGIAHAESVGAMMGLAGFRNMVLTIALVNRAMRDAADNPMDEWRRQNVRHAIGLMPGAIIGLAQEFQAGKLHDKDLPFVQGILGGFIDVNAADGYKKFMKSPSKDLIPKTGSGFPVVQPPASPYGPGAQPAAPPPAVASAGPSTTTSAAVATSAPKMTGYPAQELANLSASIQKKTGDPSAKAPSTRIEFDDGAAKPDARSGADSDAVSAATGKDAAGRDGAQVQAQMDSGARSAASGAAANETYKGGDAGTTTASGSSTTAPSANGSAPAPAYQSNFQKEISRDLASAEARVPVATDLRQMRESSVKDDFFKTAKPSGEEEDGDEEFTKDGKKRRKPAITRTVSGAAKDFKLKVKPKFWTTHPAFRLMEAALLLHDAHAEGGGCGNGECKGGGEGGGGGGGGGEAAAQILMGVAAIIAAIAPMVVASIQAKADVAIAKINADTQITMTTITSETSKQLADKQKEVALTQSNIAADISKFNNNAVTNRLELQLAELRAARNDAQQAEREKRQLELEFQNQRIALAQKQADDQVKLAKETLNAQLTQAGLSQGFSNSRNSGNQLGVTNLTTSVAGAGTIGNSLGGSGSTAGGGAATGQGIASTSTTSTTSQTSRGGTADTKTSSTATGNTSVASGNGSSGATVGSNLSLGASGSGGSSGTNGTSSGSRSTIIARNITSTSSGTGRGAVGEKVDDFFKDSTDPKEVARKKLLAGSARGARGPARGVRNLRTDSIAAMVAKPGIAGGSSRAFKQTSLKTSSDLEKFIQKTNTGAPNPSTFAGYQNEQQAARGIRTVNGGTAEGSGDGARDGHDHAAGGHTYNPPAGEVPKFDLSAILGGASAGN